MFLNSRLSVWANTLARRSITTIVGPAEPKFSQLSFSISTVQGAAQKTARVFSALNPGRNTPEHEKSMATKAIFTVASTFASQTMPIIPCHGFGVCRVTSMFLTLSPCTSTLRERQEVTSELYVLPGWPICHTFAQAALRLGRTQARRPGSAKILHLLHKSQDLRKLAQLDERLQLRVKKK